MELGQVFVVLLYLWLFASLGVYGWRAYRRIAHHETRTDRAARRAGAGPGDAAAPTETDLAREESLADRVDRIVGSTRGDRPAVADLVAGIALPCDLVPLVDDDIDPHRAVFAATGHSTTEVGAALSGELERLGFTVSPAGAGEVVAEREGAALRVQVHEDGPGAHPAAPRYSVVAELRT
jgi:hypothetical protein